MAARISKLKTATHKEPAAVTIIAAHLRGVAAVVVVAVGHATVVKAKVVSLPRRLAVAAVVTIGAPPD